MLTFPERFGARLAVALVAGALTALALPVLAKPAPDAADAAALRTAVVAEQARPRPPRFDRSAFLARSTVRDVALSPEGRNVAWLRQQGKNRSVWLLPAAGGVPKRVLGNTEANQLAWSRDGRWLLLETPAQVFAMAVAGQAGSGAIAALGGRTQREFVAVDPAFPAAILVLERPPIVSRAARRWRLYRVDMRGRQTLLHEDAKQTIEFAFDPRGRLSFLLRAEGDNHVIHRVDGAGRLREAGRCIPFERCRFAGTANNGRDLLLRTGVAGNFIQIVRLDARGNMQALHADPRNQADLDELVLDPITRQPLIASYRSTVAASYGLTPKATRHVDAINRRFPKRSLQFEVGRGRGAFWLVRERSGSLQGEHLHLYDPRTGRFRTILAALSFERDGKLVQRLPESGLARKIPFVYRASDGMRLHGFLMVPPGIDPTRAPLVANVHGGPWNHVRPELNYISGMGQFLANRRYIVFEPNFRGSTGHGRDYLFAARGDFGNGRVQQDIVDGVRYLLAQGIGDARRVGIVGASFGGYSTLLGVTFQPDLFKVGIASVPPADFGWVMREYDGEMAPGIPIASSMRQLSLDPADKVLARRLTAQSPIANAGKLRRPLLLLAGGEDEAVPIRGVTHYAAKLKSLNNRDVSLFIDAKGGHSLADPRTREVYLYLSEYMLHRHLGGAAPQPPDGELRAHIRRNLRLVGRDLQPLLQAGRR